MRRHGGDGQPIPCAGSPDPIPGDPLDGVKASGPADQWQGQPGRQEPLGLGSGHQPGGPQDRLGQRFASFTTAPFGL